MPLIHDVIKASLPRLPALALKSVLNTLGTTATQPVGSLDVAQVRDLLSQIETGLRTFQGKVLPTELVELKRAVTGGTNPKPVRQVFAVQSDGEVLAVQR